MPDVDPQPIALLPTNETTLTIATLDDGEVLIGRERVGCLAVIAGSADVEPMIVDGVRLVLWWQSRHHRSGSVAVFSREPWGASASVWTFLDLAQQARNEGWPEAAVKELEDRAREAEDRQHKS